MGFSAEFVASHTHTYKHCEDGLTLFHADSVSEKLGRSDGAPPLPRPRATTLARDLDRGMTAITMFKTRRPPTFAGQPARSAREREARAVVAAAANPLGAPSWRRRVRDGEAPLRSVSNGGEAALHNARRERLRTNKFLISSFRTRRRRARRG